MNPPSCWATRSRGPSTGKVLRRRQGQHLPTCLPPSPSIPVCLRDLPLDTGCSTFQTILATPWTSSLVAQENPLIDAARGSSIFASHTSIYEAINRVGKECSYVRREADCV